MFYTEMDGADCLAAFGGPCVPPVLEVATALLLLAVEDLFVSFIFIFRRLKPLAFGIFLEMSC